jgi:hypothetical protein
MLWLVYPASRRFSEERGTSVEAAVFRLKAADQSLLIILRGITTCLWGGIGGRIEALRYFCGVFELKNGSASVVGWARGGGSRSVLLSYACPRFAVLGQACFEQ